MSNVPLSLRRRYIKTKRRFSATQRTEILRGEAGFVGAALIKEILEEVKK